MYISIYTYSIHYYDILHYYQRLSHYICYCYNNDVHYFFSMIISHYYYFWVLDCMFRTYQTKRQSNLSKYISCYRLGIDTSSWLTNARVCITKLPCCWNRRIKYQPSVQPRSTMSIKTTIRWQCTRSRSDI